MDFATPGPAPTPRNLSTAEQRALPAIPDHELVHLIGRGSYGEVWLGRNRLGTPRAIKIVRRAAFEDPRPFEREFKGIQKFEPISRSHDGLVDILQIGGTEEYFYYVMELADWTEDEREKGGEGERETRTPMNARNRSSSVTPAPFPPSSPARYVPRTLRSDLKRHGCLPVTECLRVGLLLAEALDHLHKHGLVHRDIKPSNIIFVNGTPKLADIGLVADVSEARSFVGTEGFIAPEGPGTAQADLYSLGKVLYEMATGLDRQEFPKLPSNLRELPHAESLIEFNEIILKACDENRRQRYATAQAMRDELALLQRGQSLISRHTRQRRWAGLRKVLAVVAVITAVLVGGWYLRDVARRESGRGTSNPEAYDAFERGRFFQGKRTEEGLLTGTRYFQTAVEKDPGFARAHAGLADCYVLLVLYSDRFPEEETIAKARTAAQEALRLDGGLVEARTTMAFIQSTYDWDPLGAGEQFDQALKLDPGYVTAHHWRAFNFIQRGLAEEAVASMRRALEIQPASVIINTDMALMLYLARKYDLAIEQARRGNELAPDFHRPYGILSRAYGQKGMHGDAAMAARKVIQLKGRNHSSVIWLAQVMAWQGQTTEARQLLDELPADWKAQPRQPCLAVELAILYVALGDRESAFKYLELAWTLRDLDLRWLRLDPRLDSLRGDPRFQTLLSRIGSGG